MLPIFVLSASAAKSKQHSGGKTSGKLLPRQPGSTAEGQEKRDKTSDSVKVHKSPPTSPIKQDKLVCSSSGTSPSKGKTAGKTNSTSSPKKGMLKSKDDKHGGGEGEREGGGGGGGKGSPKKLKPTAQGPKASSTGPGSKAKDTITHSVTALLVPPVEGARVLYKGDNGFSPVAINKIEVRQRRKKLRTWPLLDESVDDDSDYIPSEDEDWEWEWGGGGGGGGGNRDDVVHCICGSDVDEGFMIQVGDCVESCHVT